MSKSNYSSKRVRSNRAIAKSMLPCACGICGGLVTEDMNWHSDHIYPRALLEAMGAPVSEIDSPSNIRPVHQSCNTREGAKLRHKIAADEKKQREQREAEYFTAVKRPQPGEKIKEFAESN